MRRVANTGATGEQHAAVHAVTHDAGGPWCTTFLTVRSALATVLAMDHPRTGPAYRIDTDRLVVRCYQPSDAALLKAAIDASLDALRPWMPWAHNEPQPLAEKVSLLRQFRGADQGYSWAAFRPDGKSIAATSDDKTVWVWTDIEPLHGVDDPRLWTATTYCPPVELRIRVLNVPDAPPGLSRRPACATSRPRAADLFVTPSH